MKKVNYTTQKKTRENTWRIIFSRVTETWKRDCPLNNEREDPIFEKKGVDLKSHRKYLGLEIVKTMSSYISGVNRRYNLLNEEIF